MHGRAQIQVHRVCLQKPHALLIYCVVQHLALEYLNIITTDKVLIKCSSVSCCCSVAQLCLPVCDSWIAAHQASMSVTISWSLLKPKSIKSVTPSNHPILCCPLLLLPSIFPSIRVLPNELALHIRWPNYWSFSFSISPSNEYSWLISFRMSLQ